MAKTALECVGSYVPDHEKHKYWVTQNRLIRHAARCWDMVVKGVVKEDEIAWVLRSLADLYSDWGKLDEAEKIYQRALQEYEKVWGPEHISTLNTVNNLGALYADQGKMDEAEKMYQRALQGYEKALGREQVKTYIPALNTLENIAVLYK
jgi:tetratricopeptide (TPR) repeat protein